MRKRLLVVPVVALALGALSGVPAQAHGHHGGGKTIPGVPLTPQRPGTKPVPVNAPVSYFSAQLSGKDEVPGTAGPVGAPAGKGLALVKIKGDRVSFAISYSGITAPTAGHLHTGVKGANGAVKAELFTTPIPATVTAAAGAITLNDPTLAQTIRTNPASFYVNLHTAQFTGGAIRGQLAPLRRAVDVMSIVHAGGFRSFADGCNEVRVPGKTVGDPDGHALGLIRAKNTTVDYALSWVNIAAPSAGHIHQGKKGVNGDVKVPLFATSMPTTLFAAAGTVPAQDPKLITQIRKNPRGFYLNIHTAEFPDGAVRDQLRGRY
jgi:hypothetical protein